MSRFFGNVYSGRSEIRRNAWIVVISSLFIYGFAGFLATKGGWSAAYPLLLVAAIVDVTCLGVWMTFRNKQPR